MQLAPREYQIRAKTFWKDYKKVYFALDMGLGKTIISLLTVAELSLPTLVVAPLGPAYNTWPDEIKLWDLDNLFDIRILHDKEKNRAFRAKPKATPLHIINYDGLGWLYKRLFELYKSRKPLPYKALILDEGTAVKDSTTNRFGYICAMRDMFSHIAILSGTPSPVSLKNLWAQYFILDKGEALGKNFRAFESKYFQRDPYKKYKFYLRPGAEDSIRSRIAKRTFRLESTDYIDLPERIYNPIYLEFPEEERAAYESFQKDFVLALEDTEVSAFNQAALSTKLRQFVQGAIYENHDTGERTTHHLHDIKISFLRDLLERNEGKSFLCLVQFKFEFEMIRKAFPEAVILDSRIPQAERVKIFAEWNEENIPLLVAHPKSVGSGMNLQRGGHNLVWFALTYSLFDYLQTNKRLHRPGQEFTVVIHHILIRGTIDEVVYRLLQTNEMSQQRLLDYLKEETKKWLLK